MPTFYPATYFGGPIHSLMGLCNATARQRNTELRVLTTDSSGPSARQRLPVPAWPVKLAEGFEIYYCRKWWGQEFSVGLLAELLPMMKWADVVHLTSAYSFSTLPTLLISRLTGKPVVWSPRGALQRWEGSTRLFVKRAWEMACNALIHPEQVIIHVTSKEEGTESRSRISRAHTQVVGNGVEIPATLPDRPWKPDGIVRLLYIGRLHQKKGIENLLQAVKRLGDQYRLSIFGSGEAVYETSLTSQTEKLGLGRRVLFHGHADGDKKIQAFNKADLCVVPSYTENFAMVVAEALAHGVPVVASRGTPWQRLEECRCGQWVENDPESLARAVDDMAQQDLRSMGRNGREWMQREFSWDAVAKQMHAIYENLVRQARQV